MEALRESRTGTTHPADANAADAPTVASTRTRRQLVDDVYDYVLDAYPRSAAAVGHSAPAA
ncbi:hypothetical protein ACIQWN_38135 [Streptomyces vinaceus]|uniref:hypothetical protein n=1 Tax=Streptomyces vinaceus TaxID=1960 RepID=UPI003819B6EE